MSRLGPDGSHPVHYDLCSGPGNTWNSKDTLRLRLSVFYWHIGEYHRLCVCVEYADPGVSVLHVDQTFIDTERPDSRRDIAAVAAVNDLVFIDFDLGEGVIDIRIIPLTSRDDRDFGGDRPRTAQTVDFEHIGRAHYKSGAVDLSSCCRIRALRNRP